jgi:drug/metabolite transporter (DMT)-like permease
LTDQRDKLTGYGLVFLAAMLWATIGVFSRTVLDAGVGALEIAFWRSLLGGGMFLVHGALTGQLTLDRTEDLFRFVVFGLVMGSLFLGAYTMAIDTGGITLAVILLYTAPAFVAVAAWGLLGESMTPRKGLLVGLVIAGVVLVAQGRGTGMTVSATSLGWGLVAAVSYAAYYIIGKRMLVRYTPIGLFAFLLPIGALGLLPFVDFHPDKTPHTWLFLGLLVVFSTYFAFWAYYAGLRHIEASRASLIATTEPVAAAGLAALFFGEAFDAYGWAGALLILGAVVASAAQSSEAAEQPSGEA